MGGGGHEQNIQDLKVPFKCPHSQEQQACTATGTLTDLALSFRLKSVSCAVKTSGTGSSFQTLRAGAPPPSSRGGLEQRYSDVYI